MTVVSKDWLRIQEKDGLVRFPEQNYPTYGDNLASYL